MDKYVDCLDIIPVEVFSFRTQLGLRLTSSAVCKSHFKDAAQVPHLQRPSKLKSERWQHYGKISLRFSFGVAIKGKKIKKGSSEHREVTFSVPQSFE